MFKYQSLDLLSQLSSSHAHGIYPSVNSHLIVVMDR